MDEKSLFNLKTQSDMDQAIAGVKNLVNLSAEFYGHALSKGFTAEEAFEMVLQWQRILFQNATERWSRDER